MKGGLKSADELEVVDYVRSKDGALREFGRSMFTRVR